LKRSEINIIMEESLYFLKKMNFFMPPFATWTPEDWSNKGIECNNIVKQQLGWNITDFSKNDFKNCGLVMFTLRNGTIEELEKKNGKIYSEKILIVNDKQITPTHFHYKKMEDIINRGGGELVIQFWNSTNDNKLSETDVHLNVDGVFTKIMAGETIILSPGESVCIKQRQYHTFWAKEGKGAVLVGEVSIVNDDYTDNHFYENINLFSEINEDEIPRYLLVQDYEKYYKLH